MKANNNREGERSVKNLNNIKRQTFSKDNKKVSSSSNTTPIRISSNLYELLREKAFYERTTIRKVADGILDEALNG